jgi:hypothetical protein
MTRTSTDAQVKRFQEQHTQSTTTVTKITTTTTNHLLLQPINRPAGIDAAEDVAHGSTWSVHVADNNVDGSLGSNDSIK